MDIIGRHAEINLLKRLSNFGKAVFIALYGRRRVGKTFLTRRIFRNQGLFFEITGSKKASKQHQLANFHRVFTSVFDDTLYGKPPSDWDDAFDRLQIATARIEQQQKVIIFLDELPWLASPRSGFMPALEYTWNRHFSERANVILIVCGSAAAWMIKHVVQNKAGLYGRITQSIPLYPFLLNESEQLLKARGVELDRRQIVELFMVTGGVGAYLDHIMPGKSSMQTINELCFQAHGALFLEFNNLFRALFNHSDKHIRIVKALAKQRRGLTQAEIQQLTKLPQSGHTSIVLQELMSCGFIMALQQFGQKKKSRKFILIDEYTNFYCSWIEKNRDAILSGSDPELWNKIYQSPSWLSWSGFSFETICLKHIYAIKKALGISSVKTQESHWQYKASADEAIAGAEIDLIIDRADNCIHLCEIKFSRNPFHIDKDYAQQLEYKRSLFREKTGSKKTLFITLITPHGAVENQYYSTVIQSQLTLDDLFQP